MADETTVERNPKTQTPDSRHWSGDIRETDQSDVEPPAPYDMTNQPPGRRGDGADTPGDQSTETGQRERAGATSDELAHEDGIVRGRQNDRRGPAADSRPTGDADHDGTGTPGDDQEGDLGGDGLHRRLNNA